MNYTTNYQLPQWVKEDRIMMEDFNDMAARVDEALGEVSGDVAAQTAAIAAKGNCQIYTGSYVGTGKYGSSNRNSFTFPGKPLIIFVGDCSSDGNFLLGIRGATQTYAQGSGPNLIGITWGENSISWYNHQYAAGQLNSSGVTYMVTALIAVDG